MSPAYVLIGLELVEKLKPEKHDPSDRTPKVLKLHVPEEPMQRSWEITKRNVAGTTATSPVSYPPLMVEQRGGDKPNGYSIPGGIMPLIRPWGVTE